MNAVTQILIAILISLGVIASSNDWNNLSTEQQEQYQSNIITDDQNI